MALLERNRTVVSPEARTDVSDRVVERRSWGPAAFGPGTLLGTIGTAGVVISLFLSWRDPGVHPANVPAEFLWHRAATSTDPSLLVFLVPIAVVLVVGTFVPLGAPLRFLGGLAMLIVAGLFAYQLGEVVSGSRIGLGDVLGTGFYIGAIGGFLALVSGMMPSVWVGRRETVRADRSVGEPVA